MTRECAWCIEELGLPATHGASHGQCRRHFVQKLSEQMAPAEAEAMADQFAPEKYCEDLSALITA